MEGENKRIIKLGWEKVGRMIDDLAKKIEGDFDGIYAIPRGGLPIGVALSHKLKLPLLDSPTKESLIVDDISDEGNTLSKIEGKKIACLHCSTWTNKKPDWFVGIKKSKDDWIEYPWEKDLHN